MFSRPFAENSGTSDSVAVKRHDAFALCRMRGRHITRMPNNSSVSGCKKWQVIPWPSSSTVPYRKTFLPGRCFKYSSSDTERHLLSSFSG